MNKGFRDPKGTLLAPDEWRIEDDKHIYRLFEDTVDFLDYLISNEGNFTHGLQDMAYDIRKRWKERNW